MADRDEIFEIAKTLGAPKATAVSETAAHAAGRIFRGGIDISKKGRVLKKLKGMIPGPLGALIGGALAAENARAKGLPRAAADEVLDSIPVVEQLKGITEIVTGREWVPAPG